uniref:AIPP2-like SPOC-like domain-containing protein n=1 Tax=Davidia involucrata TaxID=16924 RepID=A0A5B6YIL8_DAVIN
MSVCQTCGDKGEMNLLIYCMKCQDSAVHHYCLDTFSPDDDEIAWMCEECSPKVAMVAPSRSSGRIEPRKQRRRLLLVEEDSSEEFESVKDEVPSLVPYGHYGPSNIACSQPSMESDNDVPAQPVMDPIWRGCFSIKNEKNETLFGLMAHLSSKACSKVYDAANLLPPVLDVEILPRCDAWPKPFQMSPPSDDRIALYFFPENERDEKAFDSLLDEIIELNLSLKAVINGGVELLVFSSLELPQQHWSKFK